MSDARLQSMRVAAGLSASVAAVAFGSRLSRVAAQRVTGEDLHEDDRDAPTQKVCEGGRTINVALPDRDRVKADGHREILGIDATSAEEGAG